jgi:hypothetical protein
MEGPIIQELDFGTGREEEAHPAAKVIIALASVGVLTLLALTML